MKKKINRQKIIDDLCQYDVYMIMKNINREDYDWLSSIREYGFKGYTNYTDQELILEWEDSEDGYNLMMANGEQPYNITNMEQNTKAFGGRV